MRTFPLTPISRYFQRKSSLDVKSRYPIRLARATKKQIPEPQTPQQDVQTINRLCRSPASASSQRSEIPHGQGGEQKEPAGGPRLFQSFETTPQPFHPFASFSLVIVKGPHSSYSASRLPAHWQGWALSAPSFPCWSSSSQRREYLTRGDRFLIDRPLPSCPRSAR